jgi:CheY-like chemotaxis protein
MPGSAGTEAQLDLAARQCQLEDAARLTRRLAHDFGNVLTGILGFSELGLTLVSKHAACYPYLAEVHRAAQQGAELTQRLHWFSRRGPVERATSSLAAAVAHEVARLRSMADGLEMHADLPANLPPVGFDDEELRQVLRQALDNAREALGSKGIVTLSARLTELTEADCLDLLGNSSPGAYIEVAVGDTGCGLGADVRRRLFAEPFFTTKPRHRGMGLAVIYGILHCRGGGLRFNAGADSGTTLRLYLPLAVTTAPSVGPDSDHQPGRGERVLVVDDDPIVLQLVCVTLQSAGYETHAVSSAAEALCCYAAADPEPFGLVLTDVLMPHMSGVELARRLLDQDPDVNVLFMSGQMSADVAEAEPAGRHFGVLPKPFRPEGLLRCVRAALDRTVSGMPANPCGLGQEAPISSSR